MHRRVATRGATIVSRALGLLWPARRSGRAGVVARRRMRRRSGRPDRASLAAGQQLEPRLALWAQVAESSIAAGDVLPTGGLAYVVTFSEAMDPVSLTAAGSFLLYDGFARQYLEPTSVTPSTDSLSRSVATVVFAPLSESRYDLEILGPTDLAGVPLGGPGTTTPWSVGFSTDTPTAAFAPLAAATPLGGLVHGSAQQHRAVLATSADVDDVTITLAPGASLLSAVVEADPSLQLRVDVLGADGTTVVASRSATRPGERLAIGPLDVAAGGTRTFRYSALAGSAGVARTSLLLGALPEAEAAGAHTNDAAGGAEALAPSLVTIATAGRTAISGRIAGNTVVASDGFEGGVLGAAWTTTSSRLGGRVEVSGWERSAGAQSLLMDHNDPLSILPNLNEAVLRVDLSGIAGTAMLDFSHFSAFDADDAFAGAFTGHFNADGVAISADGVTWHPVWNATGDAWTWGRHSVDLSAAAAAAGIPLGAGFRIKFQQYGTAAYDVEGRFWDDVAVRDFVPDTDRYAIQMAAGQTITAYLDSNHPVAIELHDSAGTVVASGVAEGRFASVVATYSAPSAGTYHLVVTTTQAEPLAGEMPYTLVAVSDGLMEIEPNDRIATAATLPATGTVLGFLGAAEQIIQGLVDVQGSPISFGFDPLGHFGGVGFGLNWGGVEFGFQSTWTLQLAGTNYNTQDRGGAVSTVTFPVVVTLRTEGDTSLVRVTGQPRPDVFFERIVGWRTGDDHATVTTTIKNASGAAIAGVKLLESQNPDPDHAFETANDITRGGKLAVATAFGLSVGLATKDSRAVLSAEGAAALDGLLTVDPDDVLTTPVDPAGAVADTALNVAFNLGTIAAGGSASCTFAILFGNGQAKVESLYDSLDMAPASWADVDTYAISVGAGQSLTFATTTPGAAAGDLPDVRLEVLDQGGSVLAADDNGAADGRNANLTHQFTAAGTYYLRVSASPAAGAQARGSYALTLTGRAIGLSGSLAGVSTTYGTASGTTQIVVTGSLLAGVITATAPAHFEVSSDGTSFGPTATLAAAGGTLAVRLAATAPAGTHSGAVTLASAGATSVPVAIPASTVSPKALTITGIAAVGRAYDGTTKASVSGTPGYAGLVGADEAAFAVVKGSPVATFADANAGADKPVTVTGYTAPSTNYTVVDPTLAATITKRIASVTGAKAAATRIYDASTAVSVSGGSLSNIVAGDTVTLSAAGAAGTVASPNVGTNLPVTVTGYEISGASVANYELAQPAGLTTAITVRAVTIAGATAVDRTYDRTAIVAIDTSAASLVNVVPGDAVTIAGAPTGTMASIGIGTAKPVTVTGVALGGAAAANYSVSQPTGLSATITQAPVSIVGLTGGSRVYAGAAVKTATVTGTPTLSGVFTGDALTITAGTYAFADGSAGTNKPITATGFGIAGGASVNYRLVAQPVPTPGTITPKALTISGVVGVNRAYDGTTAATLGGTPAYVGLVTADGLSATAVSGTPVATFSDKNVGTLKTVIIAGFAAPTANYSVTQPTAKATITRAPVTIAGLSGGSRVYTGAAVKTATVTGTPTLSGVFAGDTLAVKIGTYAFADGNAGVDKPITAAGFAITGVSLANYVLASQPTPTPGSITPKPLTITGLVGVSRVYDGTTDATFTGTPAYSGLVTADGLTATPVSGSPVASFADKNAGILKTVTIDGYTAPTANYSVIAPTVKASITQAAVTITGATAVGRTYDGTTAVQIVGGTAMGLLPGDVAAGTVALGATGPTGKLASSAAAVAPKPVTVTGFVLEGTDAANYKVTQPTGVTAMIDRRQITISGLTANNKTYNNSTTATVSGTATLQNVVAGEAITLGGTPLYKFAQATVGTGIAVTTTGYTLAATGGASSANYLLVQPTLSADITQATLIVKADSFTIARGTAIPALTYTITGLATGDTAVNTYSGLPVRTTTATQTSLAGVYAITISQGTLTLLTTTGKKGANYRFQFVDGSITIV